MKDNIDNNSYKSIIKSTAFVGGSQVIKIIFGIIRNKIFAVSIGPIGIGTIGLYQSVIGFASQISGLGINFSSVKCIAGDIDNPNKTIKTVNVLLFILGIVGTFLTVIFSSELSQFTFGSKDYKNEIIFLSSLIFLTVIADGKVSIIQAKRKINDLVKISILVSILSTILGVILIIFYKIEGIIWFLIITGLINFLIAWLFYLKIDYKKVKINFREFINESKPLLKLGLTFLSSGFMINGVTYLTRIIIVREINLEAVGYYITAITLSSLYLNFILDAMGKDFYPRLSAVVGNNSQMSRLLNEQIEIGVLVGTPGIIITLSFAPYIISLLYSAEFLSSFDILRWQILGVFLRIFAWPLGYVVILKSKTRLYLFTELITNVIHLLLVWFGIKTFGLEGIGVAFFLNYFFYLLIVFFIARKEIKYYWSETNKKYLLLSLNIISLVFISSYVFEQIIATLIGSIIFIGSLSFSYYKIKKILDITTLKDITRIFK